MSAKEFALIMPILFTQYLSKSQNTYKGNHTEPTFTPLNPYPNPNHGLDVPFPTNLFLHLIVKKVGNIHFKVNL